jgi:hypothetical protein
VSEKAFGEAPPLLQGIIAISTKASTHRIVDRLIDCLEGMKLLRDGTKHGIPFFEEDRLTEAMKSTCDALETFVLSLRGDADLDEEDKNYKELIANVKQELGIT